MNICLKNFAPYCNTGAFYWNNLFPINEDNPLVLTGSIEFEDDFSLWNTDENIVVAVWNKDHDWEYYVEDIKEYLLVHLEQLPKAGKYKPYVIRAIVKDIVAKDKVLIIQSEDNSEPMLTDIAIFKYKKL